MNTEIEKPNELTLYDQTRQELRQRLSKQFPASFDLENTVTAYAYWVCTVVRNRGKDWASTVQEYVEIALNEASLENQAEQIELELLRRELRQAASPLLDVGAGWGRLGSLYAECGLDAVSLEPTQLGCLLLQRNGLPRPVRAMGQSLAFPAQTFRSALIGWVLHHDAPEVPAAGILGEIARVLVPGGRLLSVEPLRDDFDIPHWRQMVETAGFAVQKIETFFEISTVTAKNEQHACLVAQRGAE